jgi:hypothetical protein
MIGHEPMELFGLTRKMGDPDPELLRDGLRSKGVPEDEIEYLTGLVVERTKRGRPPENKGKLLVRNWIVLRQARAARHPHRRPPRRVSSPGLRGDAPTAACWWCSPESGFCSAA